MPRITSFAPGWLNQPAPGHKLFEQPIDETSRLPAALAYSKKGKPGPRRTIARRGTEVFVAVGKQIRWGDLAHLKESWESKLPRSAAGARGQRRGSDGSFEVYDEEAAIGNVSSAAEGYRVSRELLRLI